MNKDKTFISGNYGVEEGEMQWSFKILKKEVKVLETWHGYYVKEEKKIHFTFKEFICPPEGGDITGLTTDGRTAEGKIESNRKLVFTLKAANVATLYFEGQVKKGNFKLITGNYGNEESELEDSF